VAALARSSTHCLKKSLREEFLDSEHVDQFLHRRRAFLKRSPFFGSQGNLDYLLESLRAKLAGHANIQTINAVFAFQVSRARQSLFLILQDRFGHLNGRGRGSVLADPVSTTSPIYGLFGWRKK
jgi:hypothetical protein